MIKFCFGKVLDIKTFDELREELNDIDDIIIFQDEYINSLLQEENTYHYVSYKNPMNNNYLLYDEKLKEIDIENILMNDNILLIKGFLFLRKKCNLLKSLKDCNNEDEFQEIANNLCLDTNKYDFYHRIFQMNKLQKLTNTIYNGTVFEIDRDHELIKCFNEFLINCFKTNNNRLFSIILIGNTKIGKSICFKNCLIPFNYIEYHNNFLEFSKTKDEKFKLFRLLDDINWNDVNEMCLKAILNRNISTVNIKYGYGYVYPLINIFLMNGEDFLIFYEKFKNIWNFIENNCIIYPEQNDYKYINEEENLLYKSNEEFNNNYLFNNIIDINLLNTLQIKNDIFNTIKDYLLLNKPNIYDNNQFIEFEEVDKVKVPSTKKITKQLKNSISNKNIIKKIKQIKRDKRNINKKSKLKRKKYIDSDTSEDDLFNKKNKNFEDDSFSETEEEDDDLINKKSLSKHFPFDDNEKYSDNDFSEEDDDDDDDEDSDNLVTY